MDKLMLERSCACALNRIFGYEPRFATALIRRYGSAAAIFELSGEELFACLGPHSKYRDKITRGALDDAVRELTYLKGDGCGYISLSEECYPSLLKECDDAPAGLYVRSGTAPEELFNARPPISIVGTRDMSLYGREWCPKLVGTLASSTEKPMIVSGLAFGVDIASHMAALSYGLPTVAVLPVGIDAVYPSAHRVAAGKIISSPGGALITDYPPGTSAVPVNFLRRNRIIAGISRATILVESKVRGGGTMTARLASGYGRDVYVLPGRVEDVRSEGCNRLMKEKIAEPITSVESLCTELGLGCSERKGQIDLGKYVAGRFAGDEDAALLAELADIIRRKRGISVEELCEASGEDYGSVSSRIMKLESAGLVSVDLLQRCIINGSGLP